MERQKGFGHPRTGTTPENEEAVSQDSCAPKRYCQGTKDLTIVCTENDQKKRNKITQASQNTLHKLCHSKRTLRACWLSP